ncbi:MAG: glutamate-ammonia-ligase adenylyltransferase [Spirochaetota bacterium]|nr:glutamate-ammonia-ligase adenylyltransferase [Spirochaetota bacterium]
MKRIITYETIKSACPDIDDNIINDHLARLESDYFYYFSRNNIFDHLRAVSELSYKNPVKVITNLSSDECITCTVIARDYPAVFSLITGILSSLDYRIISGKIFTYKKDSVSPHTPKPGFKKNPSAALKKTTNKRIIIDHFYGRLSTGIFSHIWVNELTDCLNSVFKLIEKDDSGLSAARRSVNELAARKLENITECQSILYPVKIEIDNKNEFYTEMRVVSEDTPFFLYALSTALSMQNVQIEHVNIDTIQMQVIDEFRIVNSLGSKIENEDTINRIKLSVLLTKQFTSFIGTAPDPYVALSRFEYLTSEILSLPEKSNWLEILSNPHLMKDLARLLGASDFLWEDFIRLQYETILPLLEAKGEKKGFTETASSISDRLSKAMKGVEDRGEQRRILNEFKDIEIFHIDLDHILNPETDFRILSERLTMLAEVVIDTVAGYSYKHLSDIYGYPTTVAGLYDKFCIFGLGKFGGAALGYASDIEILLVYSDNGQTDGTDSIKNSDFFNRLVKEIIGFIKAKKEGIFRLDLRLRPYGIDGPLACSLDSFCKYYGAGGDAHSYERLALVRMRPVGGDVDFGEQLIRLRNEFIYSTNSIDIKELHNLRRKQFIEKTQEGRINAKYSPGALVDIEYTVQILQIMFGRENLSLRTPRIHDALNALAEHGILEWVEVVDVIGAYDFFRELINGLRMLRGSVEDLFLPSIDSIEYGHLARRMGYKVEGDLSQVKQLHIEFETRSAMVRTFIERHFGGTILLGDDVRNIADLILSKDLSDSISRKILSDYGFKNPERAIVNLKNLASGNKQELFVRIAVLATDILLHKPDPDMALNNWERFIDVISDPVRHFQEMLSQPKKLDILLSIFSTSQYLSDTLIKNPDFLEWLILPKNLYKSLNKTEIEDELKKLYQSSESHGDWLNSIRLIKKREILRIGTRDICLNMPLPDITEDLSVLAEAFIDVVSGINLSLLNTEDASVHWDNILNNFSIMAFGKLGGNELNYSSDIDIMLIYDAGDNSTGMQSDEAFYGNIYSTIIEKLLSDLSSHTEEGHAYRVDLRLRPYGSSGALAYSIENLVDYYNNIADLWEIQALLKLRPVAGNLPVGYKFIDKVKEIYNNRITHKSVIESIRRLRSLAVKENSSRILSGIDIKNGIGGIRDIEFLVQGLQLINLPSNSGLLEANTLKALTVLKKINILNQDVVKSLREEYIFLRKVEHYLQLYEDRQVHSLPADPVKLEALAKSMLGIDAKAPQFMSKLKDYQHRIREAYDRYLIPHNDNEVSHQ